MMHPSYGIANSWDEGRLPSLANGNLVDVGTLYQAGTNAIFNHMENKDENRLFYKDNEAYIRFEQPYAWYKLIIKIYNPDTSKPVGLLIRYCCCDPENGTITGYDDIKQPSSSFPVTLTVDTSSDEPRYKATMSNNTYHATYTLYQITE